MVEKFYVAQFQHDSQHVGHVLQSHHDGDVTGRHFSGASLSMGKFLNEPVLGNAFVVISVKLHLWPHPVGQYSRITVSFPCPPPNHCNAWLTQPPWPHPGHQTNKFPDTGSWQTKHFPTRRRQLPQTRRATDTSDRLSPFEEEDSTAGSRGFPHIGHDSWILKDRNTIRRPDEVRSKMSKRQNGLQKIYLE